MNRSLNQTLLLFFLYVRQIWMTRLILELPCEKLSTFNLKGFCYSYARAVYVKVMIRTCNFLDDSEDSYFCFQLALLHPVFFVFSFSLLSSSFSSLMLFHLTYMRLSQSNNQLIYMSLKTLTFIIKTA